MARICILAMNSVVRDIRIIKEADTLADAGHDVTVIGLLDNNAPGPETLRASGAQILRRDHRRYIRTLQRVERVLICGAIFGILTALIVYAAILSFSNPAYAWLFEWSLLSAFIAGFGIFFLSGFWFLRRSIFHFARRLVSDRAKSDSKEVVSIRPISVWTSLRSLVFGQVNRIAIQRELVAGAIAAKPDVIHCQDLGTLPAGVRAKRQTGARLVFDAHEIYEEVAQGNERLKRRYKKMLRKHEGDVDDFITINDSIASFYAENYPRLPKAVIIKNATVRAESFVYDGRMHAAAELPLKQKILLYQGGFATKRGLITLVEAAQWLQPDWTLVMMGWGTLEKTLKKSADEVLAATKATRKTPAVIFLPPASHEELAQWSAGGTIGVIPYENIGLNHLYCSPNKLWEYPNAGVPILCSPLVEMTKTVKENKIGWLFPEELTPEILAEAVNAISDKEIARARKACRLFLKQDNWSIYAKRLIDLYKNMPQTQSGKNL